MGGVRERGGQGREIGSGEVEIFYFIYFKKLAHVMMKADIFEICRAAGTLETQKSV